MEKIITFPMADKIEYCSVRVNNNVLTTNIGGRADNSVEECFLRILIDSFDEKINYVVDFCDCAGTINTTPDILKAFAKKNIIILASEKLKNAFSKQKLGVCEVYGNEAEKLFSIVFSEEGELYTFFQLVKQQMREGDSRLFFHQLILTQFFYYDIKNNPQYSFEKGNLKYLESSNVYVNKYINVKSLFLNRNYMVLVVKDLKEVIKREFKSDTEELVLLGVSNNGIILANLLSYELQVPVQSLNRLGPIYCLDKKIDRNNRFSNKKCVLVSDVVCMGGEYKMAQGIIDILGATLLGGVCVVKIRDIYRNQKEKNVFALLDDINRLEVNSEKIGYQIYVDN